MKSGRPAGGDRSGLRPLAPGCSDRRSSGRSVEPGGTLSSDAVLTSVGWPTQNRWCIRPSSSGSTIRGISACPSGFSAVTMTNMTVIANRSRTGHRSLPEWSPPRCSYLLFAGQHGTVGGLRDFVALGHDEGAARRAFTELRLATDGRVAWAELARVNPDGTLSLLCWFGHDRPVRAGNCAHPPAGLLRRRAFWRR